MTEKDLIVGIDSSTQSTKAIAWSRSGEAVAEGRAPIAMSNPGPGLCEQDPEDWWRSARAALTQMTGAIDARRIAGVGISNQRETIAFLTEEGRAAHPALVWLDERGGAEIDTAVAALGAERIHRITGKPVDMTPAFYRIAWMKRHAPEALARAARVVGVHGYLTGRLTGRAVSSWTSADPLGLFDIGSRDWSPPLLDHLGLGRERFSELAPPGAPIGAVRAGAGRETGLPEGTPVFAAGGDGQCAGLGANAARPGAVYLNLGTAVIAGAWSADIAISRFWRTMMSPTGNGYFLEAVQRAGTYLIDWAVRNFSAGGDDVFGRLEAEATALPVGSEGVVICPYLSGCMNPHWNPRARASIEGLGPNHGLAHVFRAALEALTLESVRGVKEMARQGVATERLIAAGGGASNALWTRMLADASGLPLVKSVSHEASSLGAAISAAVGAGWFDGFDAASESMCRFGDVIEPDLRQADLWAEASERQAKAYRPD